jgi:hypothetical protein
VEIESPILISFCYFNFSLRLMVTTNTNPLELKLGQGVLYGGLHPLHSDLVNMHNLTPTVKEVMGFQRGLNVKLILENFLSLEINFPSSIWTLEIDTS